MRGVRDIQSRPQGQLPMTEMTSRRILLVDDDAAVLRSWALVLEHAGFDVTTAPDGATAIGALDAAGKRRFSAIVSDIRMDGITGLDLLRAARARDPDVPVVLITGGPSLATAIEAMHHGAHRYLLKPVAPDELVATVTRATLLSDLGRLEREARSMQGSAHFEGETRAVLETNLDRALSALYMVYQPIISLSTGRALGFEALVRTNETSLQSPGALFDTAGRLGRQRELSRSIYASVARRAPELRSELLLFVNVHPPDLLDPSLYGEGSPLAPLARRVVLELTERASLDRLGDIGPAVADLRRLGYRLAIDDLGTGYAGLASFTKLEPDYVKLDRSMITGIDQNATQRRVVQAMYSLCADLGMRVISEGVESAAERDTLAALGADALQGYLFGRPAVDLIEPALSA